MSNPGFPDGFSITRILSASADHLWEAWTTPDVIWQWWRPACEAAHYENFEMDVQIGGHYKYTAVNVETGQRSATGGIYQELDAPERLVFTWSEDGTEQHEKPVVMVTFEPHMEGTLLYFELRGASGSPGDHFFYDSWAARLDALTRYLSTLESND